MKYQYQPSDAKVVSKRSRSSLQIPFVGRRRAEKIGRHRVEIPSTDEPISYSSNLIFFPSGLTLPHASFAAFRFAAHAG